MGTDLAQKRVVIVGGSSGMGLATAQQLAAIGAEVVIASRSSDKLNKALESIDGRKSAQVLDFRDQQNVDEFFAAVGPFDHLVLMGAGLPAWGPFADIDKAALEAAFQAKFWGFFYCAQAAITNIAANGSILFTIGGAARSSIPNTAGVAAVNGAILGMAMTLAKELAPRRVNVLSPGLVDTPAYAWIGNGVERSAFSWNTVHTTFATPDTVECGNSVADYHNG